MDFFLFFYLTFQLMLQHKHIELSENKYSLSASSHREINFTDLA